VAKEEFENFLFKYGFLEKTNLIFIYYDREINNPDKLIQIVINMRNHKEFKLSLIKSGITTTKPIYPWDSNIKEKILNEVTKFYGYIPAKIKSVLRDEKINELLIDL
jgi:hypothetical protein